MTNPEMEEKLREAACFGDIEGVKELIARGVNTNSQHDINGWTALHWAAKRNHLNIVNLLCNHGADKNVTTNKGEVAAQLTSEGVIKVLLNAQASKLAPLPAAPAKETKLPITPNYIKNPPVAYQVDLSEKETPVVVEKKARVETMEVQPRRVSAVVAKPVVPKQSQEVILKIRVSGGADPDYVELELPREAMTLEYLTVAACEELGVEADQIERVRKMPNTRLRRDREVARLTDYQEVELVLRPSSNGHEEMEK